MRDTLEAVNGPHRPSLPVAGPRALALAALALAALAACGGGAGPAGVGPAEPGIEPLAVSTAAAALQEIPRTFTASGGVEAWQRASPGTKILGRVGRVAVEEGDRVEKGALLAQLEDGDLKAAVAQAEATVAMAEAQLDNAQAQHQRMQTLRAKGSVTDKNLEDASTAFRLAEAGLARARAELQGARVTLSYSRIESPLAGWVVERQVQAGDMAAPGQPLFTLEDLSRAKVRVEVPEGEVVGLAAGDPVTVVLEVLEQEVAASVHRVVPAGDPASRTFSVQVALDNGDGRIKSGMFARVRFHRGSRLALEVPLSALHQRGQLTGVFVVDDGRALLRWVKAGPRSAAFAEVLSGLDEGERFVTAIPPELVDGALVREIPAGAGVTR